jgi:eukaryotic-like serine/threonine-protein kinase
VPEGAELRRNHPAQAAETVKPLHPGEPRQAGNYRLIASLGEGGMGRVLLGVSPDGRLAAVKQLHPGFAHDDGFRSRFRHEVQASRLVSGAYTAAVMDADPDAPTPWLASVFVAGPALHDTVEKCGPLPGESVRHLAAGLASALIEIHRVGLIHRDLKPSNVLLTDDGPRVIDFGIARAAEGASDLTGTGAIIGSPAFMSPEQAEGHPLTPASDVFSLGALLVMAATGRGPFTGSTTPQTLYNIVHAAPDLREVPPEIRALAEPCLAKNPAYRPTPAQILDFLGPVAPGTHPWPATVHHLIGAQQAEVRAALSWPAPEPPPPPPVARKRRWVPAVVGALAAGVLTAGTVVAVNLLDKDGNAVAAAADPVSLDTLRRVDPCKVLADDSVPDVGRAEPRDSVYFDRCDYTLRSGSEVTLKLGEPLVMEGMDRPPGEVEGMPVLFSELGGGTCDASVQLPAQQELGITAVGESCDTAKATLGEAIKRIRTGAVGYDLPQGTLLPVDPCTVIDKTGAAAILGPVTKVELSRLRECEWTASGSVRLTFLKMSSGTVDGEQVDLGGVTGHLTRGGESCSLEWSHRPFDENESEDIRIAVSKPGGQACQIAETFAKALVPKLPKPR